MSQHVDLPGGSAVQAKAPRRSQAERSEETKRRILDAAAHLLSSKGYAGFRISEVASLAQVSRGAQTHHFPTKDSLLLAALEEIYVKTRAQSMALIASLKPEDDIVAAMQQDGVNFFLGPHFSMALSLINVGDGNTELSKELRKMSLKNRRLLDLAWTDALVSRGIPRDMAEIVLSSTYCIYRGLAIRELIHSDAEHIQKVSGFWHDLLRDLLSRTTARAS